MANTLNNLIPDLYAAMGTVSREMVGFIPSVTRDSQLARAAVGQNVRIPIAPAASASDITPAVTPPNDGDQTFDGITLSITKSRRVPVRWTGEEERAVSASVGVQALRQAQFAQAMRTLVNEIERDLAKLYVHASRAIGSSGATPFGVPGDYSSMAKTRQILADNGAPTDNLRLVINTNAGANLRGKQAQVAMAGDNTMLRQGVLQDIHGIPIRESAQIQTHTSGAGTGYAINKSGGYDIATTTFAVSGGTVNTTGIQPGDVLTASGFTSHHYVVAPSGGRTTASGNITINAPGLRDALPHQTVFTSLASYSANMLFAESAILLATRAPALPDGGDMADDRITLTDPVSGLSFEVSAYRQYRQVQYEVSIAWGVACLNPAHLALLLG